MQTIKGYRVIPLKLGLGLASHYIYVKQHTEKSASNDKLSENSSNHSTNTLFVGNIDFLIKQPLLSNVELSEYYTALFEIFGDINNISISSYNQHTNTDGIERSRFAYIEFLSKKSIKAILQTTNEQYNEILSNNPILQKYSLSKCLNIKSVSEILSENKYFDVNLKELQEKISNYMKDFDENEEILQLQIKKHENDVDEDGFQKIKPRFVFIIHLYFIIILIIVFNRNKRTINEVEDINDESIHKKTNSKGVVMRSRVKRQNKELQNFYRHQIRQDKRDKLETLRTKFEQDKLKIADMKLKRKFKPF